MRHRTKPMLVWDVLQKAVLRSVSSAIVRPNVKVGAAMMRVAVTWVAPAHRGHVACRRSAFRGHVERSRRRGSRYRQHGLGRMGAGLRDLQPVQSSPRGCRSLREAR